MAEIRFKRASLSRWVDLNPVLGPGEPGYVLPVIDDPSFKPSPYHSLKVGDGVTHWNDLPYVDECRVQIYRTQSELPVVGTEGVLYLILLDRSIKTFYVDPSRLDENEYTGEYISFMGGSDDSNSQVTENVIRQIVQDEIKIQIQEINGGHAENG